MEATRESNQVPAKRFPVFTRPPLDYSKMSRGEKDAWCLAVAMQIHANAEGQEKISNDEENLPT